MINNFFDNLLKYLDLLKYCPQILFFISLLFLSETLRLTGDINISDVSVGLGVNYIFFVFARIFNVTLLIASAAFLVSFTIKELVVRNNIDQSINSDNLTMGMFIYVLGLVIIKQSVFFEIIYTKIIIAIWLLSIFIYFLFKEIKRKYSGQLIKVLGISIIRSFMFFSLLTVSLCIVLLFFTKGGSDNAIVFFMFAIGYFTLNLNLFSNTSIVQSAGLYLALTFALIIFSGSFIEYNRDVLSALKISNYKVDIIQFKSEESCKNIIASIEAVTGLQENCEKFRSFKPKNEISVVSSWESENHLIEILEHRLRIPKDGVLILRKKNKNDYKMIEHFFNLKFYFKT
ncbi:hypothetical protein [Halobacteriovorax sp. ZH5_bin.2]|uniref:hypothetical protein n=1 Tax=Halobacteriovorax sp. ZH5_bin.2 TaxID=3157727 RepID=UPI00371CB2E7